GPAPWPAQAGRGRPARTGGAVLLCYGGPGGPGGGGGAAGGGGAELPVSPTPPGVLVPAPLVPGDRVPMVFTASAAARTTRCHTVPLSSTRRAIGCDLYTRSDSPVVSTFGLSLGNSACRTSTKPSSTSISV